jgi:sortase A
MTAGRRQSRRLVGYALIAAGLSLLFLGARDLLESRAGQAEAQREFDNIESAKPSPFPARSRVNTQQMPQPMPPLGDAVAKLIIPRLNTELYVVEGDGAAELRRGPGHMSGTPMPGQDGNCIIAGHRDTHFRVLKDIRKGDAIVLETGAGEFTYRVSDTQVVSPSNTASLRPTRDPELHLITCYPFYYLGSAPQRFVVQARLEEDSQADAAQPQRSGAERRVAKRLPTLTPPGLSTISAAPPNAGSRVSRPQRAHTGARAVEIRALE